MPVGVTGHRTQRPRSQVGPPGPHPAQTSSPLDPDGARGGVNFPLLASLIAQLVHTQRVLVSLVCWYVWASGLVVD